MKVLVIEDDPLLLCGLEKALLKEGYKSDLAQTLTEAEAFLSSASGDFYSAILLDLGLPDGNGITFLQRLRAQEMNIPILIVTARDSVEERILGLDAGADDYLLKPFEIAELYARLRAIIRRYSGVASNQLKIADFVLNLKAKMILKKGEQLSLTLREYAILSRLLLQYGQVVSRELLIQDAYTWDDALGSNTLEVYIHRLRQKIGRDQIKTVRGIGYQMRSDEQ